MAIPVPLIFAGESQLARVVFIRRRSHEESHDCRRGIFIVRKSWSVPGFTNEQMAYVPARRRRSVATARPKPAISIIHVEVAWEGVLLGPKRSERALRISVNRHWF
jgi:hypothetical protein